MNARPQPQMASDFWPKIRFSQLPGKVCPLQIWSTQPFLQGDNLQQSSKKM